MGDLIAPARDEEVTPDDLVTAARLREFFAPRSIAAVGASDTSGWSRFLAAAALATGFTGPLLPVHPVHDTVFGRAARSLRDLAEPPDLAFVMVPTRAVPSVIDDAIASGVRNAVVLASGYREVGAAGRALEDELAARAAAAGLVLLGPNCLGFLNAHARVGPFALNVPLPLTPGPVGVALQSGALSSVVLAFARSHAIGVSSLTSLGNEAMITTADVLDYLVEDERTRVICVFLEEIGQPARFAAAAARAERAGKPLVVLKAGTSPAGQRAALAHTGSVAGDDAVVSAFLDQVNAIRVHSIEELLTTAALLGYGAPGLRRTGRGATRMGVLTASGGACDLIADRASELGLEIPPFAEPVAAAMKPLLPPFGTVRNPLDVTGYILANARTSALTSVDHALDAAVGDPGLDLVLFQGLSLPDATPPDARLAGLMEERVAWLGRRAASSPVPVVLVNPTCVDVTPYQRDLLARSGLHVLGGIDLGLRAIAGAARWAERRGSHWAPARAGAGAAGPGADADAGSAWAETAARELLAGAGVPVVPAELVSSADEAVAAAARLGAPARPVVLKVCSAWITHKSDVGGVALGLRAEPEIRAAYARVRAAGERAAAAAVDGVLVSPQRSGGLELLAGVTVDPSFGPVLAVGLGGVWVELLGDTSLRVLPADAAEVARMLAGLRAFGLLRGARGTRPADLDALAAVIARLGEAALSLGGELRALEVNPLWVHGDQIEALDALVVTTHGSERGR